MNREKTRGSPLASKTCIFQTAVTSLIFVVEKKSKNCLVGKFLGKTHISAKLSPAHIYFITAHAPVAGA